jgi:hypothetical protein
MIIGQEKLAGAVRDKLTAERKDEGTRARLTTALRRLMAVLSGTIEEAGS